MNASTQPILRRVILTCAGLALSMSLPVAAHHSFAAHYDSSKPMELKGQVVEWDMRSPHSFLQLDTVDANGVRKRWEIETDSVPGLRRMGIDRDTFKPGDIISVTVWPNRRPEKPLAFGRRFVTESGRVFATGKLPEVEAGVDGASGIARLNGRWMTPVPNRTSEVLLPLNDVSRSYWEQFDPELSSANACVPATIPSIYDAPYLFDIRVDAEGVVLHHEVFNVTRNVKFGAQPTRAEDTGWFGLVSARPDGDQLIVESVRFPPSGWGLAIAAGSNGGGRDVPSSPEKRTVERFSVSEDGKKLRVSYTVEDPVYLTGPYSGTVELTRVADDTPMYPYDCEIGSAARFSAPPP